MQKRILIPVDGSAASQTAASKTLAFVRAQGAAVRIVHVCEPMQYIFMEGPVDLTSAVRRQGKALLQAAAPKTQQAGIQAETSPLEPTEQRVVEAVIDEASRCRPHRHGYLRTAWLRASFHSQRRRGGGSSRELARPSLPWQLNFPTPYCARVKS